MVLQHDALQSQVSGRTAGREELEQRYRPLFREDFSYRQLVTYVPNKSLPIHRWFKYPQGYSPQLVERILTRFNAIPTTDIVLDPFAGCGTTMLAAKQLGYQSWGLDRLPTSVFVASVKLRDATEYDLVALKRQIEYLLTLPYHEPSITAPTDIRIVRLAYTPQTLAEIMFFREAIEQVPDRLVQDFLMFALMAVLESVSFTSKDGQFLRLVERTIPPVREVLAKQLHRMYGDLSGAYRQTGFFDTPVAPARADVYLGDARDLSLFQRRTDVVITSPPYLNRYDYTRIFGLELCLRDCRQLRDVVALRHSLLRSHIESKDAPTRDVNHPALEEVLDNLAGERLNNDRIPIMVRGYFEDMNRVIEQLYAVSNPGAYVALVVGNARFHGELIPVDLLLCELAVAAGFSVDEIIVTRYKGNSSQQMGRFGRVPVRESILFWSKSAFATTIRSFHRNRKGYLAFRA